VKTPQSWPVLALGLALWVTPSSAFAQDKGYAPVPVDDDPPKSGDDDGGYGPAGGDTGSGDSGSGDSGTGDSGTGDSGTGKVTASRRSSDGGGGGDSPDILRPSTRPMWGVLGFGPDLFDLDLGGRGAPGARRQGFVTRFSVVADFGWHFDGSGEGPAIGGTVEQTFGSGLYTFSPGGKFWWDIEIADMAIYVAPFGKVGYVLGSGGGSFVHGLNLGFGAEGRVVLDDRWMLIARPAAIDLFIGDFGGDNLVVNASFIIGGGATF
jgi:hypothetical protein